jgi:hypothetical protein
MLTCSGLKTHAVKKTIIEVTYLHQEIPQFLLSDVEDQALIYMQANKKFPQ